MTREQVAAHGPSVPDWPWGKCGTRPSPPQKGAPHKNWRIQSGDLDEGQRRVDAIFFRGKTRYSLCRTTYEFEKSLDLSHDEPYGACLDVKTFTCVIMVERGLLFAQWPPIDPTVTAGHAWLETITAWSIETLSPQIRVYSQTRI